MFQSILAILFILKLVKRSKFQVPKFISHSSKISKKLSIALVSSNCFAKLRRVKLLKLFDVDSDGANPVFGLREARQFDTADGFEPHRRHIVGRANPASSRSGRPAIAAATQVR